MDRLVAVDSLEIRIDFIRGQKAHTRFRLRNLMHTMSVAFKVLTNEPKRYCARPCLAILPPLGEIWVDVVMVAQEELPEVIPVSEDKFYVKTLMLPTGKATDTQLNELFSRKIHIFTDATLKVVFTGGLILRNLVANGSPKAVKDALVRCSDVNGKDKQDPSLLHIAAIRGNGEIVLALLEAGAIVDAKNSSAQTPLIVAALHGHAEVVKILVRAGANQESADTRGCRALHVAASCNRIQVLITLLDSRANVNARDTEGKTPLHAAVIGGHLESVHLLVGAAGNVDAKDKDGYTPLHCAAARGNLDMVEFLLERGSKYARNNDGKTAFGLAMDNGHQHLLDVLYLGDILQRRAREDNLVGLKSCLAQGAVVNGKDQHGWTALHRAAFKGHLDSVKLLLEHGAEIDGRDDAGFTPLHCAAETGRKEVVEYLIKHGADVNAKTMKGVNPSYLASSMKYSGIFRLLKEKEVAQEQYERCHLGGVLCNLHKNTSFPQMKNN